VKKEKSKFNIEDFKEDINYNAKLYKVMKPAEGVSFVQYDQFGLPIGDQELDRAIARDGDDVGFEYIAPNQEQMERVL